MSGPKSLIFDISQLMETATGTREFYSFDIPIVFDGIKLTSNISGKIEIMKIDNGFNARVTDINIKVEFICKKCLKKFSQNIQIAMAERQVLMQRPVLVEDINDLYLVNKKDLTINLDEFLRQEIILHFPLVPVCSKSCKGLCPICGRNKNKTDCHCRSENIEKFKPLKDLKKLLK